MGWARPRLPLAVAASLDAGGLVVLAVIINALRQNNLAHQQLLLLALVLIYLSLGWLFGSYTLLKQARLHRTQMLLRLATAAGAALAAFALMGWLFRVSQETTLLHRGSLIPLCILLIPWSALVRLYVYNGLLLIPPQPAWQIVALKKEAEAVSQEWQRGTNSFLNPVVLVFSPTLWSSDPPCSGIALSNGVINETNVSQFCEKVVGHGHPVISLSVLAEQYLQRIPPHWVSDQWLMFSNRIDGERTNFEQQLKRFADVVISAVLLLLSTPVLAIAAWLIWLEDGASVIYCQQRTGLLGKPFSILKLRSMIPNAEGKTALWAKEGDKRITKIGFWLRRTRIDELPQLINVLKGEMSLIGPRPERTEIEEKLEAEIPNYRLRYWIRPGLSGWAQVNMPYTSSVEDSELKLSYDLFYLRNANLWLDLLIMAKTIKTVLKAAGR